MEATRAEQYWIGLDWRSTRGSVGARCESLDLGVGEVDADHGLPQVAADLGEHGGVAVVGDGLHDGPRAAGRVAALEDAGADEDAVAAELYMQ